MSTHLPHAPAHRAPVVAVCFAPSGELVSLDRHDVLVARGVCGAERGRWDLTAELRHVAASGDDGAEVAKTAASAPSKDARLLLAHGSYVAVVEKRGTRGVVLDVARPEWRMPLARGDYRVANCSWPLGFVERDGLCLVHGTDWNRLDVTHLASGVCLTDRVVEYEPRQNYRDYFHSLLHVSPSTRRFVSNGWAWAPQDFLLGFEVSEFLATYELGGRDLYALETTGYHWDRPCCFVDDTTVAWAYSVREDSEANNNDAPVELVLQDVCSGDVVRRVPVEAFDLSDYGEASGTLAHLAESGCFVASSPLRGTVLLRADGEVLKTWAAPSAAVSATALAFVDDDAVRIEGLLDG